MSRLRIGPKKFVQTTALPTTSGMILSGLAGSVLNINGGVYT